MKRLAEIGVLIIVHMLTGCTASVQQKSPACIGHLGDVHAGHVASILPGQVVSPWSKARAGGHVRTVVGSQQYLKVTVHGFSVFTSPRLWRGWQAELLCGHKAEPVIADIGGVVEAAIGGADAFHVLAPTAATSHPVMLPEDSCEGSWWALRIAGW